MIVTLQITGVAKTAGSKRVFHVRRKDGSLVFGKGGVPITNVTDDCKGSKQWRKIVQDQARAQWPTGVAPFAGPLAVCFYFAMARPKSHYRTGKFSDQLRDDAPTRHTVKPDVLKLTRAAEDALTGIAWIDDAQICQETMFKVWADSPGMTVTIKELAVSAAAGDLPLFSQNSWGEWR